MTAVKQHCLEVQRHSEIKMFATGSEFSNQHCKKYLFLLISAGRGRDGILRHSELYIYTEANFIFYACSNVALGIIFLVLHIT